MAQSIQHSAVKLALEHPADDRPSPIPIADIQMLLVKIFNLLVPFVEDGNINSKSAEGVSINEAQNALPVIVDKIKVMDTEERAKLLSTFEERDFNSFLEQSNDLEQLQSIQYLFTRRINNLKKEDKQQTPRRPVIAQRKVGDFLYKLQATQKGDSYWYIQFSREGKRVHKYLGKERPSFNPEEDLARAETRKTLVPYS